jgi:hypothetical protein
MGLATSVAYPARLKTLSKALSSSKNRVLRLADGQEAARARAKAKEILNRQAPYRQPLGFAFCVASLINVPSSLAC